MGLSRLPLQLLPPICQHLSPKAAAALARCCRAFRRIVQNTRACRCGLYFINADIPHWIMMGPDMGSTLAWVSSSRIGVLIVGNQQFLDFWTVLCAECRRRPGEFLRLYLRVKDCSCLTREHLALLGAVCQGLTLTECWGVTDVGMLGGVHDLVVKGHRGVSFTGLEALVGLIADGPGRICSFRAGPTHTLRACAASGRRR